MALRSVTSALREEEVDDLVLVQRRAQLGGEHRLLLDQLEEALALLALILRGGLGDQPVHLLLADLDSVRGADLRQQQAEAHAALGDPAIFGRILLDLGKRGLRIGLVARLVAELVEDVLIFGLDHRFRHREIVPLGELVEQLALHVRAGQPVQLLLDAGRGSGPSAARGLEAERLGELVVDLGLAGGLHRLHLTAKIASLPFRFSTG